MKTTLLTLAASKPHPPPSQRLPNLANNHSFQQQQDLLPSSSSPPTSLLDAIPINIVTSLRRPNGDVIGILKPRAQILDAVNVAR
ncbi:hypothetical protein Q7P35_003764 [Cladosporium inversicolor]